ncbi:phosphoglycerate kinase [Halodesulfurarchaeum formicicum]|uniref:Phosphoglycerate kinase n=1 Tax=Halodesulfurarchaeum formicicum TaxID=1873524 RepID=A0A1J1ABT3_9EURY|nr:phosphoglycerate kinase [Halodesulfurarchaeum formicicum]APE95199.1 phosphoglycerate kinase [Halodesulfurarchaeum formicicum]
MAIRTLDDLALDGTSVGVRVDINSPLGDDGHLADDARLRAHVDTLSELLERGGKVTVLAHQGRPGGSEFEPLEAHATRFDELLDAPVMYTDATSSAGAREAIDNLDNGQALVLENTRFYSEEYMEFEPARAAQTHLVDRLAPHFDAFVNDAFAAAHRSQPSLVGFSHRLDAYAGRVMEREIDVLGNIDQTPTPRAYVVGGAKVPDSIRIIRHGIEAGLADTILTSGLVANVFLMADGIDLGEEAADYIMEKDFWDQIDRAAELLAEHGDQIELPVDVAVKTEGKRQEIPVQELPTTEHGDVMDIGSETVDRYAECLESTGTAILNGPAGVFEDPAFQRGTKGLFQTVADTEYSVVGGGDTARAIRKFGIDGFDHVSTGGGAALAMLTGQSLPAIEVLDS